jgi:hypothetical protein
MFLGNFFRIYCISKIYVFIRSTQTVFIEFQEKRKKINQYLAARHLSMAINKKTLNYYIEDFGRRYFDLTEVEEPLSDMLKSSIKMERLKMIMQMNSFFNDIPEDCLAAIANCIQEVKLSANDVAVFGDHLYSRVFSKLLY